VRRIERIRRRWLRRNISMTAAANRLAASVM
jgi:hypothetical protein